MPVGFGFGVGDLIATIGLFKGVAVALKDHGGARDDHAKTLSKLETASSILSCLENHYSAIGDVATSNAIRGLAHLIRRDVEDFLASIEKYKGRLSQPHSTTNFLSTAAKIKWSQFVAKRVTKLHQEVQIHMSSLHLLLDLNNIYASNHIINEQIRAQAVQADTNHANLKAHTTTGHAIQTGFVDVNTRLDCLNARLRSKDDLIILEIDKKHEELKFLVANQRQQPSTSPGVMLVLTFPQLNLSAKDIRSILRHFYEEVKLLVQAFLVSFLICFKDLLLATPQLFLVYRMLQRLPAAVSLTLHDNITLEDALGRVQSLQFQQFRHWRVFEASLRCHFDQLPGMRQVLSGNYVLTLPNQGIAISAQNWAAVIRPGVLIEMAIVITHFQVQEHKCPRGCLSGVTRLRDEEYCCNQCRLLFQCHRGPVMKASPDAIAAVRRPWIQKPICVTTPPRTRHVEIATSQDRKPLQSVTAVQAERQIVDSHGTQYQPPLQSHTSKALDWGTTREQLQQAINEVQTNLKADMRDLSSLKRVSLHDGHNRIAKCFVKTQIPDIDIDLEVLEIEIVDFLGEDASVKASVKSVNPNMTFSRPYIVVSCRALTTDMLRWIRKCSKQYWEENRKRHMSGRPLVEYLKSETYRRRDLGEKSRRQHGTMIFPSSNDGWRRADNDTTPPPVKVLGFFLEDFNDDMYGF